MLTVLLLRSLRLEVEAEAEAAMWKGKAKTSFKNYRTVLLQVRKVTLRDL